MTYLIHHLTFLTFLYTKEETIQGLVGKQRGCLCSEKEGGVLARSWQPAAGVPEGLLAVPDSIPGSAAKSSSLSVVKAPELLELSICFRADCQ